MKTNMLQKHTLYSFTINPDDTRQRFDHHNRTDTIIKYVKKHLDTQLFEYYLLFEYSNPSNGYIGCSKPRLHAHGYLYFRNNTQLLWWYESSFYNLSKWCSFEVDTINDPIKWETYVQKSQEIMQHLIDEPLILSLNFPSECLAVGQARPD